jgi:hypothetical protein
VRDCHDERAAASSRTLRTRVRVEPSGQASAVELPARRLVARQVRHGGDPQSAGTQAGDEAEWIRHDFDLRVEGGTMSRTTLPMVSRSRSRSPLHVQRGAAAPAKPKPVDLNDIELPPEAARHNELGMEAYRAGDFEAAYRELKRPTRAWTRAPTSTRRDMVLASLRGSLVKLYEKTGELQHLCLARTELLRAPRDAADHLRRGHRPAGHPRDQGGGCGRSTRRSPAQASPRRAHCDGPPMQVERPHHAAPPRRSWRCRAHRPDRGRPALIVGATSLSVGGVLLGAMTYALFMRRASDDGIKALGAARDDAAGRPPHAGAAGARGLAGCYVGSYHRTTAPSPPASPAARSCCRASRR